MSRRRRLFAITSILLIVGATAAYGADIEKDEAGFMEIVRANGGDGAPGKQVVPNSAAGKKLSTLKAPIEFDDPISKKTASEHVQIIEFANTHLQRLRWLQRNCVDCYVSVAGSEDSTLDSPPDEIPNSKKICVDRWTSFYKKDPVDPNFPDGPKKPIDIRLVLGYMDSETDSFVSDQVLRKSMVKSITQPCERNNLVQVCGFVESADDGDVFEKEVLGPTGDMQKVRLTLVASSVSTSSRVNKVEQEIQSSAAENVFLDGLCGSDMALYVGHARGGGGPDFRPATRVNGRINYPKYEKERPGMKKIERALANRNCKPPQILGLFACDAAKWRGDLQEWAPNSGILLSGSDQVELQTLLAMSYLAIDSVLWQRCSAEFNRAMGTLNNYKREPTQPASLQRFFPSKTKR